MMERFLANRQISDISEPADMVDAGESPLVHEPEYDDPKELYAFFGLAAYFAQCFERSLMLLIVAIEGIQLRKERADVKIRLEDIFSNLDHQTLGRLIKRASGLIQFDQDFERSLPELLSRRNYLMHHFYYKNAIHLMSDSGRRKVLDELRSLAQSFQDADRTLTKIYEPLWYDLGMTEEMMGRALDELLVNPDAI